MTLEESQEEIKDLKAKVSEFRDNNVKLKEQIEAFDGIDAAKVRELLATE